MHRIAKIRISHLNEQMICGLCFGYLIDAVTIVECLHSFCRSCLVQYLSDGNNVACPLCCQLIHKTKPLVNIRSDKTLQNLVYKLVPGLFRSEMERRRNFYSQHPEAVPDVSTPNAREDRGDIYDDPWSTTPNNETDLISISIQYSAIFPNTCLSVPEPNDKRYLLCPSYITVSVLKKFIRCKFDLPSYFHIELYYSDECLDDSYSVMDIANLYSWRRTEPLRLFYFVLDSSPSSLLNLRQTSLMSVTHNNGSSISDEGVVEDEQAKKRKRKFEHSCLVKPIKMFRIRNLDKIETCTSDATLSSKKLSSTSVTGVCDEALQDKGTNCLSTSTSDSKTLNVKKTRSLESSGDNRSLDNENKDNGSMMSGARLEEETPVDRTLTAQSMHPLRLLRLSPKLKPHPTELEVSNSVPLNKHHHSGTISSSSRSGNYLSMTTSHKVPDATGSSRPSSLSCHQPASAASTSSMKSRSSSATEPRSIWSVLPSPRLSVQEDKLSANIRDAITARWGDSRSSVSTHAEHHHRHSHSQSSFSIYEDPIPLYPNNPSTSTKLPNTSTKLSTSTKLPSTSTKLPNTSTKLPNTSTKLPNTSTKLPNTSTKLPNTSTKLPNTSTELSASTKLPNTSTKLSTSTIPSTPTAKVGIVICRGRAMPLQDKHLHLTPTTPTPLPPPPSPPPPPHCPLSHSCPPAVTSSSSDSRRPASVKRLLQIKAAESENLTATKRRKLSGDQEDTLPPMSTASPLHLTGQQRRAPLAPHTPTTTAKQKVARVFRDRNALASSSLCPPSSKLSSPAAVAGPLSPLLLSSTFRLRRSSAVDL